MNCRHYHKRTRNHPFAELICIFTAVVFIFSLIPFQSFNQSGNDQDLRDVILQVQELYTSHEAAGTDFNSVFSSTIKAIQATAGLSIVVARDTTSNDIQKSQIVVSVRLPYLLSQTITLDADRQISTLQPSTHRSFYQSHIIPPDSPPPELYSA